MERLHSENLSCLWVAALNYNLRSNLLEWSLWATKGRDFGEEIGCCAFAVREGCPVKCLGTGWQRLSYMCPNGTECLGPSGKTHTRFHCVWSIWPLLEFAGKSLHFFQESGLPWAKGCSFPRAGGWSRGGRHSCALLSGLVCLQPSAHRGGPWLRGIWAVTCWFPHIPFDLCSDKDFCFRQGASGVEASEVAFIRIFPLKTVPNRGKTGADWANEFSQHEGIPEQLRGPGWSSPFGGQLDGGSPLGRGPRSWEGSLSLEPFPILKNKLRELVWFWGDFQVLKSPARRITTTWLSRWSWKQSQTFVLVGPLEERPAWPCLGLSSKGEFKDSEKMPLEVNFSFFLFRKCLQLPSLPQPLSPTLTTIYWTITIDQIVNWAVHKLSLILTVTLQASHYDPHFMDKEIEAWTN